MRQARQMFTAAAILIAGTTAAFAADTTAPAATAPMKHGAMHGKSTMSKDKVQALQTALNNSGESVAVDGVMGPKTHGALKDYQKKNNLKQTGQPDRATLKHLNLQS